MYFFFFFFKLSKLLLLKKKKVIKITTLAMSTGSMLAYSKTGNGICYFLEATKKEPYPFKIKIYILKKKKNTDHSLSLLSLSNYWFPSSMASLIQFLLLCCSFIYLLFVPYPHNSSSKISHTKCSNSSPSPKMLQPSNTWPKFIMALHLFYCDSICFSVVFLSYSSQLHK